MQNTVRAPDSNKSLDGLYSEFWEFNLREVPRTATYLGDHRYDDQLEDVSETAFQRRMSQYALYLERLDSFKIPQSEGERLNYELFERRLMLELDGAKFKPYLTPLTQQTGPHIDLPQLTTYQPFNKARDFENYIARLQKVPLFFDQLISNMRAGVREKIVPARIVVEKVVPQLEAQVLVDPEKSEFYKPVASLPRDMGPDDARAVRKNLVETVTEAIVPAYEKLKSFVSDEYLPASRQDAGVWALKDGKERYSFHIRFYTTTDYSSDKIHEIGIAELKRIHAGMHRIMQERGFNGTLQDFINHLRGDPSYYYHSKEELLAGFKAILRRMDEKLPLLFGRLPKAEYGFREIEEYRAEAAPDAYYYRPPADGSRPGYFYVNTHKPETRPKYTMEALAYHEAVPGHHLQIAIQQELTMLPMFRRFGGYTAFVEGWAHYSEQLPKEVGFYTDSLSEFGRLTFDALRAARLVVDSGIHAKRWTRDQAIRFMRENTALSDQTVVSEVDRYIAWPGQALAYKIGQLKISELRARAERILGPRFEIRAFHDELLSDGALALDVLDAKLARWLGETDTRGH